MNNSKEIIVGRGDQADVQINDPSHTVSRKHAKITREADGIYIEDMDSGGGTFVNGRRILKKKISLSDQVKLGENYLLDVARVLEQIPLHNEEYKQAFAQLQLVYDTYNKTKIKLQSEGQGKVMLKRTLPMAIPGIIGCALSASLGAVAAIFGGVLSAVAMVCGAVWASKEQARIPQMMQELDERFKIDYSCPDCHHFFGFTPWLSLKKQGKCPFCRRKFNL